MLAASLILVLTVALAPFERLLAQDKVAPGSAAAPAADQESAPAAVEEAAPVAAEEPEVEAPDSAPAEQAATNYKQDPFDASKEARLARNKMANAAFSILRNNTPLSGNEAGFDNYWNQQFFAEMTQIDTVGDIGKLRDGLLDRALRPASNREAHDRLVKLTFDRMTKIAADNYHPFVRYNALLIIGDLSEREPTSTQPGIPYKQGFAVLMQALGHDKLPDGLRVAALRGVVRHVEAGGLSAAELASVREAAFGLLTKAAPAGRSTEAHDFIRRRAADVLGMIGDPGQDNAAFTALSAILADDKASLELRVAAARAVGRMNLVSAGRQDPAPIVRRLGQLAVESYRLELASFGEEGVIISGRRLLHRLKAAQEGLLGPRPAEQRAGVASLAQDPAQTQLVDNVNKILTEMIGASGRDEISEKNADELRKTGEALASLVGAKPATPSGKPAKAGKGAGKAVAKKDPFGIPPGARRPGMAAQPRGQMP
jgi:hypothetical protein